MRFHKRTVMLVSSSGGHLTQLLVIERSLTTYRKVLVTENTQSSRYVAEASEVDRVCYLPHGGRERIVQFIFKFSFNFVISFLRYIYFRPRVVIMTGAHTVIPTALIAKFFGSKLIFVETFAKLHEPSKTGRFLYRFCDVFYIQWLELKKYYPNALFKGRLY